jgi:hypothetical protein
MLSLKIEEIYDCKPKEYEYGYKKSNDGLGYVLLRLDTPVPRPVDHWVLDYKGDDEEEILSELYLRYIDKYYKKETKITSKDWLNTYLKEQEEKLKKIIKF